MSPTAQADLTAPTALAPGEVAGPELVAGGSGNSGNGAGPSGGGSGGGDGPGPGRLSILDRPEVQQGALALAGLIVGYGVLQILWPAPLGVLVLGAVIGGLTALIAFGIALVYRANRIVNFAQGDLGAFPATLGVLLIVSVGLPYWIAFPAAIIVGLALGAVIEFLIIRRFFKAPRLILTVATLALIQILMGLGLLLPRLFDITTPPQSFPSPFDFTFTIGNVVFRGNHVVAMVMIPVIIAGLAAFFRFTHIGIAVRASAESAERAFLVGIPVKRIHTIVWVLAAGLSTVALLLRAGIVGLPIGSVLGPAVLLRALAAAVIGRMERLPTIFVAAVGLGIVEQSIVYSTGRSILVAPILFVIILGALLLQRRGTVNRAEEGSSWQAASAVRPVPRELRGLPEIRFGGMAMKAAGLGVLLALPLFVSGSQLFLVGVVGIFAIIGLSLVVLTGWTGQLSFGHMGLVGIGAAVGGSVTGRLGWDLGIALVLAGVAGALVAIVIGLPALRIKGLFLAVATFAFAGAASSYLLNREFFGWWLPEGRVSRPPLFGLIAVDTEPRFYYLILAGLIAALFVVSGVRNSRAGRIFISVRENERAAQAFGANATRIKLTAFALSGFIAAYAGALFVHHQRALPVAAFRPEESLAVFTMVVIGGLGSIPGALLGAVYVYALSYFLPSAFRLFTSGFGLLLVLMLIPGGLGSVLYQVRDWGLRLIANRRKILVPSLVADSREFVEKDKSWDMAFTRAEDTAAATELAGAATAGGPLTSGEEMRQADAAASSDAWAPEGGEGDVVGNGAARSPNGGPRRREPLRARSDSGARPTKSRSGRTKR
jgi:branched-chain amino acid transport system permease protein